MNTRIDSSPAQNQTTSLLGGLVVLARPWHWIKNIFVLMPLPFAVAAGAQIHLLPLAMGLAGFSLLNSAVYVLNDFIDLEADRLHPAKRSRPLASGRLGARVALVFGLLLLLVGLALCLATGRASVATTALVYLGLNVVYSMGGKQLPLVDVFLLASGYVMRVYLGCFLVDVTPSNWLLLCSLALALFLGLAKRRADLNRHLPHDEASTTPHYTEFFLDQAMTISAGMALFSYAIYTVNSEVLIPGREFASLPFVAYGILNYLRLIHVDGATQSPVEIAYRSPSMQICGIAWLLSVLWSLEWRG